eukprot:4236840-Prorocentrum_lima.AAC.1
MVAATRWQRPAASPSCCSSELRAMRSKGESGLGRRPYPGSWPEHLAREVGRCPRWCAGGAAT